MEERGPRDVGSPIPDNAGSIRPLLFPDPLHPVLKRRPGVNELVSVLSSADPLCFEPGPDDTEERLAKEISAFRKPSSGGEPTGGTGGTGGTGRQSI